MTGSRTNISKWKIINPQTSLSAVEYTKNLHKIQVPIVQLFIYIDY